LHIQNIELKSKAKRIERELKEKKNVVQYLQNELKEKKKLK